MLSPLARLTALAALTFAVLGAGCSRVDSDDSGRNPWTKPGLLRIVDIAEPDSLNPIVGDQQIDSDLMQFWGGMFFNWTDRNTFDPELATVVPTLENGGIAKDGRTITYHLRRGVTWHDGAPFTADDVIFTWHAIMNKRNNVPSTVGFDLITAIDRVDAYTIVVHLRRRWAPFVSTFFAPSSEPYPVLPKHLLARYSDINRVPFNSQPVGTGPFVVERWQRGSKIVFRANPHYWRGRPKLDTIWYSPVPSQSTIVTLLRSHDADLEYRGSAATYDQLKSIPGTVVRLTPFTTYAQLATNTTSPKLRDVAVRRAIWGALDLPEILRDVTHGVNTVAYTDQPEFLWAYNPNVTHYAYDPGAARAALDAAGWKVGPDGIRTKAGRRLSLELAIIAGDANDNAVAVIAQRNLHDVGVEVEVKGYTTSLFFAAYGANGILQRTHFDLAMYSWANGTDPDDSTLWMCDQMPPAGQNVYRYCNRGLDAQERVALGSYDRAVRKRAYDRIQATLATDVPAVLLWYERQISVANSDLKQYRPAHAVTAFWNSYAWSM